MNRKAIQAYNNAIEKEERQRLQEILSSHKMPYDFTIDSQGFIEITIIDGDWKHDHIALKNVMREAGYVSFGRHIPEDQDNDDDSFTAIYLYR
jgi:hypothetical protein